MMKQLQIYTIAMKAKYIISILILTCITAANVASMNTDELRHFEFPNDQPGAIPRGGGGSDDLFRQGITNGTVLSVFPGYVFILIGFVCLYFLEILFFKYLLYRK